jgi:hypothetical protein
VEGKENILLCMVERTHNKQDIWRVCFQAHDKELVCPTFFLCHAPYKKRMANKLFTVRLK